MDDGDEVDDLLQGSFQGMSEKIDGLVLRGLRRAKRAHRSGGAWGRILALSTQPVSPPLALPASSALDDVDDAPWKIVHEKHRKPTEKLRVVDDRTIKTIFSFLLDKKKE